MGKDRIDIHNHTRYSNIRLIDALATPEQLIDRAIEIGLKGIAITDHEFLGSHIKANKKALEIKEEHPDFKVILGNEIYLVDSRPSNDHYHFILLAKDAIGHKQLRKLSTRAWLNSYFAKGLERVDTLKSDIEEICGNEAGHLIASTACFLPGQQVLTKKGYKNIEEIKKGDFVKNFLGNWEMVTEPTHRLYNGTGKKITFQGSLNPLYCTDNHQLLVSSNNYSNWSATKNSKLHWKRADELITKKGGSKDYGVRPLNNEYTNNLLIRREEYKYSLFKESSTSPRKTDTLKEIYITPEIMRLFGL